MENKAPASPVELLGLIVGCRPRRWRERFPPDFTDMPILGIIMPNMGMRKQRIAQSKCSEPTCAI